MTYIEVTPDGGKEFFLRYKDKGVITMLNLLRFREIADYREAEHLRAEQEISGREAYDLYMQQTKPFLVEMGSRVLFAGDSKHFVIRPMNEQWDYVLLVQHSSVEDFMKFAQNEDYQ